MWHLLWQLYCWQGNVCQWWFSLHHNFDLSSTVIISINAHKNIFILTTLLMGHNCSDKIKNRALLLFRSPSVLLINQCTHDAEHVQCVWTPGLAAGEAALMSPAWRPPAGRDIWWDSLAKSCSSTVTSERCQVLPACRKGKLTHLFNPRIHSLFFFFYQSPDNSIALTVPCSWFVLCHI